MDNQKKLSVVFHLALDADFDAAIAEAGFDTRAHFFRQAARAMIRAHRAKEKIAWPLTLLPEANRQSEG